MHHRQDRQMVLGALEMAVWQYQSDEHEILYFDRRGQFRSGGYQCLLSKIYIDEINAMIAVGHCGDNAACKGLFRDTQKGANKPNALPDLGFSKS